MRMRIGILMTLALLLLLAVTGTTSALPSWGNPGSGIELCSPCHELPGYALNDAGDYFKSTHSYDDSSITITTSDCSTCHINAKRGDYDLLSGTPTFLTSETCKNCHKAKYEAWYNGTHRVKLVPADKAKAAGYPLVNESYGSTLDYTWDDISYVIGGKWKIRYINSTGYIITKSKDGSATGSNQYNVLKKTWDNYETGKDKPYDCGKCHTTGYDSGGSFDGLPGIIGNWTETGIGCEACHGAGGNGHQVSLSPAAEVCGNCHTRSGTSSGGTVYNNTDVNPDREHHEQYNDFVNSPHNNSPLESPYGRDTCQYCHSPFEYIEKQLKNISIPLEEADGITCAVCHDPHDVSDDRYAAYDAPGAYNADLFSDMLNISKINTLSSGVLPINMVKAFNTTATKDTGDLTWDNLNAPANRTVTETLCLNCHTRHGNNNIYGDEFGNGFIHRTGSGNSHAEAKYPTYGFRPAGCVDCHMPYSSKSSNEWDIRSHTFEVIDGVKFEKGPFSNFPELTCGRDGKCHSGTHSLVPVYEEWNASQHNNKEEVSRELNTACAKCKSPFNWDPSGGRVDVPREEWKGIDCATCHNIHDMGNWLKTYGVPYAAFNASKYTGERHGSPYYYAGYDYVETTTELCYNCHTHDGSKPSWTGAKPSYPHHPQGDIFVGSWKNKGGMKFDCTNCHMQEKSLNETTGKYSLEFTHKLPITEETLADLSVAEDCNSCHSAGSALGLVNQTVEDIQTLTKAKWNEVNATVEAALVTYNDYSGVKDVSKDKLAEAYWNLHFVQEDKSWGVHNPSKVDGLLDDAERLANEAVASLGMAPEPVSNVSLKKGWNLVALNGVPTVTSTASVMSSVKDNITVVWGYNAGTWELYDPAMDPAANTLENVVPSKGYWIYAKVDCEWTV